MTDKKFRSTKAMRDLAAFFTKNPSEELSIDDAAVKIGVCGTYAGAALSSLAGAGILERVSVYRLRKADK